jgi:cobalt/nickel transport system permease protein
MINFSIPATGSSGHLGGGLLLAVLLGPYAAYLTIASVLVVQALFFADGGLLALGCNIFNIGFIPAFIVYPFIYKKMIGTDPGQTRVTTATLVSAIVGLQLGAFSVVLETFSSGVSALPFATFLLLMLPIHLAIGVVEGFVTVSVVAFVLKARPEILHGSLEGRPACFHPVRNVLSAFLAVTLLAGGVVSMLASRDPDGLEWAIARVTGKEDLKGAEQGVHGISASLQGKTAFLPGYSFRKPAESKAAEHPAEAGKKVDEGSRLGTSISGIFGSLITLALALIGGFALKKRRAVAHGEREWHR